MDSAVILFCVLSLHKTFLIECSLLNVSCLLFQASQFVGPMPKSVLHLLLCSLGLTCSLLVTAFLCSEDLRRWFLQQEMDLLRYRFNELTEGLRQKFLEHVNLSFEAVSMLLPVFVLCCMFLFFKICVKIVLVLSFKKKCNYGFKKTTTKNFSTCRIVYVPQKRGLSDVIS